MIQQDLYLYVFDGLSDWEKEHLHRGLHQSALS
jgi:hypothetical protein